MIQKINNVQPLLTKIAQKPKTVATTVTAGTLAVLSTRQAWPYCQGLGQPQPLGDPKDYELRWVNGIQTYIKKDLPIERFPKVDVEDANMPIEMSDAIEETNKLYGLSGVIDNAATHIHDGLTHLGDKAGNAWDNVKDFFENLGQ